VVKKDPGSAFWCSSGKGKEAQVYGLKSYFIWRRLRAMTSIPPHEGCIRKGGSHGC
jgi:hypothetical protein